MTIAVRGLGLVGSTIAAVWLRAGAKVMGINRNKEVVRSASSGNTHTKEPRVREAFESGFREGRLSATADRWKDMGRLLLRSLLSMWSFVEEKQTSRQ